MPIPERVKINPQIVHELIQGEVVAINLVTGCYYSLTGVAGEVWSLLAQPMSAAEVTEALARRYGSLVMGHAAGVADFIANLHAEELVVDATAEPSSSSPELAPADPAGFTMPVLQKYGDMRDLLLIDPIHEVGESGWPVKPTPPAS